MAPNDRSRSDVAADPKGKDLFIVDNSVSGWTGLRYLEEWSGIAKAFDIATGYFEIGSLLALDGKWQPLEKIRILMGAETTHRTRKALLDAVRTRAVEILDSSIEADKGCKPFPARRSGDPRGAARRADRVPRLRQGQVPRQGVHHARQARSRRLAGAGRVEQLHRARPDRRTSSSTSRSRAPARSPSSRSGSRPTGTRPARSPTPSSRPSSATRASTRRSMSTPRRCRSSSAAMS